MSRPLWSQSGHLLLLSAGVVVDVIATQADISVAWIAETLMLAATTSPKIEANARRSQEQTMLWIIGDLVPDCKPCPITGL
ncbi:MAG: hypothetical protein Q8M19_18525 [Reyranella sp.]|nr:hypothetical protein [Reyranella sp.]